MSRVLIPNSTQIPDIILDHWMAELSGGELKALLYIARRTYGFGKDSDSISLTQITSGIVKRDGTVLDRGTGMSRSSVARSLKQLEERGIIIRQTNVTEAGNEFEETTYRINLNWQPEVASGTGGRGGAGIGGLKAGASRETGSPKTELPRPKKKQGVVPKTDYGWSQNSTTVVRKPDLQETALQESGQETASSDAAALFQALLSHGVGRSVAEVLVRDKPETCRRYLEYLPYADVRTTKGAWLAKAIEQEWGPPRRFEEVRAKDAKKEERIARENALLSRENERRRRKNSRLMRTLARMEEEQGERLRAFNQHVQEEQARVAKMAAKLSGGRRDELLATFATTEKRLQLLDDWLKRNAAIKGQGTLTSTSNC